MRNATFKLITESREIGFEGAVNSFLHELDELRFSYSIAYAVKDGLYCAFVTYGNPSG